MHCTVDQILHACVHNSELCTFVSLRTCTVLLFTLRIIYLHTTTTLHRMFVAMSHPAAHTDLHHTALHNSVLINTQLEEQQLQHCAESVNTETMHINTLIDAVAACIDNLRQLVLQRCSDNNTLIALLNNIYHMLHECVDHIYNTAFNTLQHQSTLIVTDCSAAIAQVTELYNNIVLLSSQVCSMRTLGAENMALYDAALGHNTHAIADMIGQVVRHCERKPHAAQPKKRKYISGKEWNKRKFKLCPTVPIKKQHTVSNDDRTVRNTKQQLLKLQQNRVHLFTAQQVDSNTVHGDAACFICGDVMVSSAEQYTLRCCTTTIHIQCLHQALRYRKQCPSCEYDVCAASIVHKLRSLTLTTICMYVCSQLSDVCDEVQQLYRHSYASKSLRSSDTDSNGASCVAHSVSDSKTVCTRAQ